MSFEASFLTVLGHQTRRRILSHLLENDVATFTDLLKTAQLRDSGDLCYHLKKLGGAVTQSDDRYSLSPLGFFAAEVLAKLNRYYSSPLTEVEVTSMIQDKDVHQHVVTCTTLLKTLSPSEKDEVSAIREEDLARKIQENLPDKSILESFSHKFQDDGRFVTEMDLSTRDAVENRGDEYVYGNGSGPMPSGTAVPGSLATSRHTLVLPREAVDVRTVVLPRDELENLGWAVERYDVKNDQGTLWVAKAGISVRYSWSLHHDGKKGATLHTRKFLEFAPGTRISEDTSEGLSPLKLVYRTHHAT